MKEPSRMRLFFNGIFSLLGYRREEEYDKVKELLFKAALYAMKNKSAITINIPQGWKLEIRYKQ